MADYNLAGLSSREFEHLVQALCQEIIAEGMTPFGDGPDGGREATYSGAMNYPSSADPWNGYLVVQCKFLTRPHGSTSQDGGWAFSSLRKELALYADPASERVPPDYYVFATNAVLSAVQTIGYKDRVTQLLQEKALALGIKGFAVWDYDKLCRELDSHPAIRQTYAALITPSDVLSEVLRANKSRRVNFEETISLFVQNELRADQFARLEQAGHSFDQKVALANVFVDLPVSDEPIDDSGDNESRTDEDATEIVKEIVEAGSRVLKPSVMGNSGSSLSALSSETVPIPGRYVVVGGPGQGKSTVTQFICQLYRAAILSALPPNKVSSETASALELIQAQCNSGSQPIPAARRFPVRIVLDQFASILAARPEETLLGYIANRIQLRSGRTCTANEVREWLAECPWLLLLDGLDEVPVTSNRSVVMEKIADFWGEVATTDADVLVLATTRPQGYNSEFSSRYYKHLFLVPLSRTRALEYAQRLTAARYGTDEERKMRVLARLRAACEQVTTRRLMTSPLQVTIMATLVERVGQPPHERWRLFKQYYEVIYQRETERDIPASRVLLEWKADVDAIHQVVGLLLQSEGERPGLTQSRLPLARFRELVHMRLESEGHIEPELTRVAHEIISAATDRLVFLVGLESEKIGFEIRSFQEFMAAESLMSGGDAEVCDRLASIAVVEHWRNVFLFAAGNCFAARQFLRDRIVTICAQLNDVRSDAIAGTALAGSRLALDILFEGAAQAQPKYERLLAENALRLLEFPDDSSGARLAGVYNGNLDIQYREAIIRFLRQRNTDDQLGAWGILRALASREVQWAIELADRSFPIDLIEQRAVLLVSTMSPRDGWSLKRFEELAPLLSPASLIGFGIYWREGEVETSPSQWFGALLSLFSYSYIQREKQLLIVFNNDKSGEPSVFSRLSSVENPGPILGLADMPAVHSGWRPYLAAGRFAKSPTPANLSTQLRWLSESWPPAEEILFLPAIPWPLAACLQSGHTSAQLDDLASRAEKGELGSEQDWRHAEVRWTRHGVSGTDWDHAFSSSYPFDKDIASAGFPLQLALAEGMHSPPPSSFALLYANFLKAPPGELRQAAAAAILHSLAYYGLWRMSNEDDVLIALSPSEVRELVEEALPKNAERDLGSMGLQTLSGVKLPASLSEDWISIFEDLGDRSSVYPSSERLGRYAEQLADAIARTPSRIGLLKALACLVLEGASTKLNSGQLSGLNTNTPSEKLALAIVQLSLVENDRIEARQFIDEVVSNMEGQFYILGMLTNALHELGRESSFVEFVALTAYEHTRTHKHTRIQVGVDLLTRELTRRVSLLQDKATWARLNLPNMPAEQSSEQQAAS